MAGRRIGDVRPWREGSTGRRNRIALDPRKRAPHSIGPRRAGWRLGDEIAPNLGGLLAPAVLLGGQSQIVAGADSRVVERYRPDKCRLGFSGDNAVGFRGQRLAEIGFTVCVVAEKLQGVAPRRHRIRIAVETHIDRRQNFPATAILRVALQMGLGLGNQIVDGILRGGDAGRRLLLRGCQFRRPKPKIKAAG